MQVGLVTSVTYLTVAYTLPSAFCLKLLRRKQPRWENALQVRGVIHRVYGCRCRQLLSGRGRLATKSREFSCAEAMGFEGELS